MRNPPTVTPTLPSLMPARVLASLLFALLTLSVFSASSAEAQAPRLQFVNRPAEGRDLSGTVTLRISPDPILRPKWIRAGIRMDGRVLELAESLPWSFSWDTTQAANGDHIVQLVLVNTRTDDAGVIEELHLSVRNIAEPAPAPIIELPKRTRPRKESSEPSEPIAPPARGKPFTPAGPPSLPPAERTVTAKPAADPEITLSGRLSAAEAPLAQPATAMAALGGRLLVGRKDGSVAIFDPSTQKGSLLPAPSGGGEVLAVTRANGLIWWVGSGQKNGDETSPTLSLRSYREKDGKVSTYDISEAASAVPTRLIAWHGHLLVLGRGGGCAFDIKSAALRGLDTALPKEIAAAASGNAISMAAEGNEATLAHRHGSGARLWHCSGGKWLEVGTFAVAGGDTMSSIAVTPRGALILDSASPQIVSFDGDEPRLTPLAAPSGEGLRGRYTAVGASGAEVWYLRGATLFRANLEENAVDAFLPWNGPAGAPRFAAADADGAWLATDKGVQRLNLSQPDPQTGYAGYVRARLGAEADQTSSPAAQRLSEEIASWQGVPYFYGGASRSGTDCSGFVMNAFQGVGIGLPHGSNSLRSCREGALVRDELHYGDVLVYPGHCAIYIGNGLTAETASGKVGGRSIWFRESVVVRRFLDMPIGSRAAAPAYNTRSFASRGGYPRAKISPKKKPASRKH